MSNQETIGDQTSAPLIEAAIDGTKVTRSITSQDVVSSMAQRFKPISLITLVDYIQKHRDFSIHQFYSSNEETPHLNHLKKQPVFKAIYYKGNEELHAVEEIDSVMIEHFDSLCVFRFSLLATGLKPPVSPKSFFLPEGYASFDKAPGSRIFTFLLGGTSSERWSAACLNVYTPTVVKGGIRYIPEGVIILSPFNNLSQLKDILKGFLIEDYPSFSAGNQEKKHQMLLNLLSTSTTSVQFVFPYYIGAKTFLSGYYAI